MTVIGVLEPSGATAATTNEDDQAVLPITTAQRVAGRDEHGGLDDVRRDGFGRPAGGGATRRSEPAAHAARRRQRRADFTIASQESLLETANATNGR